MGLVGRDATRKTFRRSSSLSIPLRLPSCNALSATVGHKPRPTGTNVVDLISALQSLATEAAGPKSRKRKSSAGQKEMLMSIEGKKPPAKRPPSMSVQPGRGRPVKEAPGGLPGAKRGQLPQHYVNAKQSFPDKRGASQLSLVALIAARDPNADVLGVIEQVIRWRRRVHV